MSFSRVLLKDLTNRTDLNNTIGICETVDESNGCLIIRTGNNGGLLGLKPENVQFTQGKELEQVSPYQVNRTAGAIEIFVNDTMTIACCYNCGILLPEEGETEYQWVKDSVCTVPVVPKEDLCKYGIDQLRKSAVEEGGKEIWLPCASMLRFVPQVPDEFPGMSPVEWEVSQIVWLEDKNFERNVFGDDVVGYLQPNLPAVKPPEKKDKPILYSDPDVEAKLFPHLFVYGKGHWKPDCGVPWLDYSRLRLLNICNKFRDDYRGYGRFLLRRDKDWAKQNKGLDAVAEED